MNELEFKAYHYARTVIELGLLMGWIDITQPDYDDTELQKHLESKYLEKQK